MQTQHTEQVASMSAAVNVQVGGQYADTAYRTGGVYANQAYLRSSKLYSSGKKRGLEAWIAAHPHIQKTLRQSQVLQISPGTTLPLCVHLWSTKVCSWYEARAGGVHTHTSRNRCSDARSAAISYPLTLHVRQPGLPAQQQAVLFRQEARAGGLDRCTFTYPEDAASVPGLQFSPGISLLLCVHLWACKVCSW